jgi:hypothetical protein
VIWRAARALLRAAIAIYFCLTAVYGAVTSSPFAYDMFIRPRLLPWVNDFVAWHHAWFLAVHAASLITIAPEILGRNPAGVAGRLARWAAIGYAIALGAVSAGLVSSPHLPALEGGSGGIETALLSFVPLLWLSGIDILASAHAWRRLETLGTLASFRLFVACAATAAGLWAIHGARAWLSATDRGGPAVWTLTLAWSLALTATIFTAGFAVFVLIRNVALRTRAPGAAQFMMLVVLIGVAACEFLRRLLLPTIGMNGGSGAAVAAAGAAALAAAWSAIALRRLSHAASTEGCTVVDLFLSPVFFSPVPGRLAKVLVALLVPAAAVWGLSAVERLDWDFALQRTIVAAEWVAAFGAVLALTSGLSERRWSTRALPLAFVASLAAIFGIPRVAMAIALSTGEPSLQPSLLLQRHAAAEVAFRLVSGAVVSWPGQDTEYHRYLQVNASPAAAPTIPEVSFTPAIRPVAGAPDVYLFVIDSLRRDYLSPYNPAVMFTPEIQAFADESFVFRNAFTRHGGTHLSMPSIWSGGFVVRRIGAPGFERMNAIEKLLNGAGYRLAINDYTVHALLRPETAMTVIDPGVPSPDTDLCQNLTSLEQHMESTAGDRRPLFAYMAPMNVHLINTRRVGGRAAPEQRVGFYEPYASRLQRLDECFGAFVAHLKERGRYDNAIVILTSDHGESLGEDGYWGHSFWLFPEDIRVPLIVRLPERVKAGVTTDLARLTFTTDIAPTLYRLLGQRVAPPGRSGQLFGAPLFVAPDEELPDRRRGSYLLTSSYAATYGLLRRNGRQLYVSDLFERTEMAFDLTDGPNGTPVPVDHELRQLSQRLIRERVAEAARFYSVATGAR